MANVDSDAINKMLSGVDNVLGWQNSVLVALDEFQLDERDIVPNVYFYNVPVYENGSLNGLPTAIKIINIKT